MSKINISHFYFVFCWFFLLLCSSPLHPFPFYPFPLPISSLFLSLSLSFPFFFFYCAFCTSWLLTWKKLPKYHEIGGSQGYFSSSRKCQRSCKMSSTNFILQAPEVCIWIHICIFWVRGQTETFSLFFANKHVSSFFTLTSVVKNVIFPEVYLFCL